MAVSPRKVAIACQGGGTHAAFEVGVLTEILERLKPENNPGFELVGLSGTSAGALCALNVWYGLATKANQPGSPAEAIRRLNDFWDSFAATTPAEILQNSFAQLALTAQEQEVPLLGIKMPAFGLNPRGLASHALIAEMLQLGVRKEYIDFDAMLDKAWPEFDKIDWDTLPVRLLLGASEILNGIETVFDSDCNSPKIETERHKEPSAANPWRKRLELDNRGAAASGTLPAVQEARKIGNGYYWDGLYSQNPPIREFLAGVKKPYVPDEIWVIRINPQQSESLPETTEEIEDRENELMGNLSLNKELDFILTVNDMITKYRDVESHYKNVTVRTIKMTEDTAAGLLTVSKFDRSRTFIDRLRAEGRKVARDWLARWPSNDPRDRYPDDAGYD